MTIDLTDDQINKILEDFDWNSAIEDIIDDDYIEEYIDKYPEFLINYLYRLPYNIETKLKENGIEIVIR